MTQGYVSRIGLFLFAFLFCSIALSAPALSQSVQLPQTGQTKCYDTAGAEIDCAGTGQDGDIRAGVPWPDPRFTSGTGDEADCMIDNLTGLMWPKNGNLPGVRTWYEAIDYANSLNLCGHSDWRLPNVNELESLVPDAWLNSLGFYNVQQPDYYWSSSTYAINAVVAWAVDMRGYVADTGYKDLYFYGYVWSVRANSAPPTQPWKTGQTESYRTGDDGDMERGGGWPVPRFTDQGNGTVTDNLTGLMWTKDANAPGLSLCGPGMWKTWQQALDYVKCLNTTTYLLGHSDWRLPNRKELMSLIDWSRYNPALPFGHPFDNVQSDSYWSSTTCADYNTDSAWVVNMRNGFVDGGFKDYYFPSSYVWPVRAGQVGDSDIIDGQCGSSNGQIFTTAPSANLCAAGTASTVSGTGPWIWTCKGSNGGTDASCQAILRTYSLTVSKVGTGKGSVVSDPPGISCGGACTSRTGSFASGQKVTLTATAKSGSAFMSWRGCASVNGPTCTVVLTAHTRITATFKPFPVITSLSPAQGTVGSTVVITGNYFGATKSTSTVSFGGVSAKVISWSNTAIVCKVPMSPTTGAVVVTTLIGTSSPMTFTMKLPIITSLSRSAGRAGTVVTINGNYFGPTRGTSTVSFGGVSASTYHSWSNRAVVCKVPTGAGTGPVTVTTSVGSSSGKIFTVRP